MADNPQTEIEILNDVGAPLPTSDSNLTSGNQVSKIKGASTGTEIGNTSDRLRVEAVIVASVANLEKTYSCTTLDLNVASNPTDIFILKGSATKKIKITRFLFSGIQTNSGVIDIVLIKRSSDNTGGTRSAVNIVSRDSSDAAATAQAFAYTGNPSALGTSVGILRAAAALLPNKNTSAAISSALFEFTAGLTKPVVLNNENEYLVLNLNGNSVPGSALNVGAEWTEE